MIIFFVKFVSFSLTFFMNLKPEILGLPKSVITKAQVAKFYKNSLRLQQD
jgi:hypothetical protein